MCGRLVGDYPNERMFRRVVEFLNGTHEKVCKLAHNWFEAREQEIAQTGRFGGSEGKLVSLTPENTETFLLRIHKNANILVGRDCSPDERCLAQERLHGTVSGFPHLSTAWLHSTSEGLTPARKLVAHLVSDYGMAFLLHERLLPALRDAKLIRCIECGRIDQPARSWQKRCADCVHSGVREGSKS